VARVNVAAGQGYPVDLVTSALGHVGAAKKGPSANRLVAIGAENEVTLPNSSVGKLEGRLVKVNVDNLAVGADIDAAAAALGKKDLKELCAMDDEVRRSVFILSLAGEGKLDKG